MNSLIKTPEEELIFWENALTQYETNFKDALHSATLYGSCIRSQHATAKRKVKEFKEILNKNSDVKS